jgi:hypothetical protein
VLLLIAGDKLTTYYSIKNLQKNSPAGFDALQAEKNPVAKWFMTKMGLGWGNVIFALVSILQFYLALWLLQLCLRGFHVTNYIGISWYVLLLVYAFTIGNNIYFVLKHGKILP